MLKKILRRYIYKGGAFSALDTAVAKSEGTFNYDDKDNGFVDGDMVEAIMSEQSFLERIRYLRRFSRKMKRQEWMYKTIKHMMSARIEYMRYLVSR